MAFARLICRGKVVVEQMDFTPSAGQIVVTGAGRYRVLDEMPEVHHVTVGVGIPMKWMNVVEVEAIEPTASN